MKRTGFNKYTNTKTIFLLSKLVDEVFINNKSYVKCACQTVPDDIPNAYMHIIK